MPPKLLRNRPPWRFQDVCGSRRCRTSGIPTNDASVHPSARQLNDTGDTVTLTVTSRKPMPTNKLIGNYVKAFQDARRAVSAQSIQGGQQGSQERAPRDCNRAAERGRVAAPPTDRPAAAGRERSEPSQAQPKSRLQDEEEQQQAIPIIPPGADSDTTLMLFERNALANRIDARAARHRRRHRELQRPELVRRGARPRPRGPHPGQDCRARSCPSASSCSAVSRSGWRPPS